MISLVVIFLLSPLAVSGMYQPPRVNMIQRQACYFVPFEKELTCQCTGQDTNTFLSLKLMFFIKEKGQEVRSVVIESCLNLILQLDLTGVNPTHIPFKFKNIGRIALDSVKFDPRFTGSQLISLEFETVNSVVLEGVDIQEAVQISTSRVKELFIHKSNFTHVPLPGLSISQTDKLSISESIFTRISPGSINVQQAKEVEVVNNQFNINAIKVVNSTEGSSLYISCNRLLGVPGSPECVLTSTSTPPTVVTVMQPSTTTTATTTTAITTNIVLSDAHSSVLSLELLIGLVVGIGVLLILLFLVVIYLCCKRKKKEKEKCKDAEVVPDNVEIVTEQDCDKDLGEYDPQDKEEKDSLLMPETPEEEEEHLVEASKPRFSSPIWLDEIHNNKIFNKQRSIINTENLLNTPHRPDRPFPVRSISEIIEPESDTEDEKSAMITEEQRGKEDKESEGDMEKLEKVINDNGNMENSNVNASLVPETDL